MKTGRSMVQAIRALRAIEAGEAPADSAETLNDAHVIVDWALREGINFRFDHARRGWLQFDGDVWRDDRDGATPRNLQSFLQYRLQEAVAIEDKRDRERLVHFYTKQLSAGQIQRLLVLARHQAGVATAGDNWDEQPDLLAVRNGVLDLEAMDIRPGNRDEFVTRRAAVEYDPCANAPRWTQFVAEVCSGDWDRVNFLQRFLGYCLTGHVDEQVFLCCHGAGANGKSTLVNTISNAVIPEHSWTMSFPTASWTESLSEYQRASLVGRRFVIAQETERGKRLNAEFLKSITGGDTLNARQPYGRPFTYRPQSKLVLCVNYLPVVSDDSHGIWRRVLLLPFERTFPVNPEFGAALASEAEGILNWMVRGAFAWYREGLVTPTVVEKATAAYRRESDHITTFLDERCIVAEAAVVRASVLFDAYRGWCDANNVTLIDRLSQRAFGERIRRDFTAVEGRQVNFRGVTLRETEGT